MTLAAKVGAARAKLAATRCSLPADLIEGYAQFYADSGATHELTISLGIHPKRFDPETEFIPQMRRLVREITHRLRGVPKRRLLSLGPVEAVWMAGFYEPTMAGGILFPHWHGVIGLSEGEEPTLRALLVECLGEDVSPGATGPFDTCRPLITLPHAKPTFHLTRLATPERYIAYANKGVRGGDPVHWTTADFLPSPN